MIYKKWFYKLPKWLKKIINNIDKYGQAAESSGKTTAVPRSSESDFTAEAPVTTASGWRRY